MRSMIGLEEQEDEMDNHVKFSIHTCVDIFI